MGTGGNGAGRLRRAAPGALPVLAALVLGAVAQPAHARADTTPLVTLPPLLTPQPTRSPTPCSCPSPGGTPTPGSAAKPRSRPEPSHTSAPEQVLRAAPRPTAARVASAPGAGAAPTAAPSVPTINPDPPPSLSYTHPATQSAGPAPLWPVFAGMDLVALVVAFTILRRGRHVRPARGAHVTQEKGTAS